MSSQMQETSVDQQFRERVAVVIPALNAAETIGTQIAAVLADRDEHVELVLVNNGSTDATLEVMHALTDGLDRITIVTEPRRGVNRARNAGIAATDAPILLLCDADDEIEPGWVNGLASALENFDLVGGALRAISADGEISPETKVPGSRDPFGWGLVYGWGGACGLRRETWEKVGGFDNSMSGGGDEADFFVRAQINGATFTWRQDAVVRYSLRADPAKHGRKRRDEGWRNFTRSYWYGRLRGWPRDGHFFVDLVKSALLLPLAPFSGHWRSIIRWRLMRRWGRLTGTIFFLPKELRHRISDTRPRSKPDRFRPTWRFRRDWQHMKNIEGWLSRDDAAALHAAASRVQSNEAIVEIGSWKGRSTAALALGCQRRRLLYAVDPHTGGMSYVETGLPVDSLEHLQRNVHRLKLTNLELIVSLSHDAAKTYSGPPIGLLFIDGWHSFDAVIDDYESWAPHLAPGATIVFDDRPMPEVSDAISKLQKHLPPRMFEFGKLSVFTDF